MTWKSSDYDATYQPYRQPALVRWRWGLAAVAAGVLIILAVYLISHGGRSPGAGTFTGGSQVAQQAQLDDTQAQRAADAVTQAAVQASAQHGNRFTDPPRFGKHDLLDEVKAAVAAGDNGIASVRLGSTAKPPREVGEAVIHVDHDRRSLDVVVLSPSGKTVYTRAMLQPDRRHEVTLYRGYLTQR